MIQNNNVFTGLPFYSDPKYRNGEKWWVQNMFRLASPNNQFLPFQLLREPIPVGSVTCPLPSSVDYIDNFATDIDGWEVHPDSPDSAVLSVSGGRLVVEGTFGGAPVNYLRLRRQLTSSDYKYNASEIAFDFNNVTGSELNVYSWGAGAVGGFINEFVAGGNSLAVSETATGDGRSKYLELLVYKTTSGTATFELYNMTASATPYALITNEYAYDDDWSADVDGWQVLGTSSATLTVASSRMTLNFNSETEVSLARYGVGYSNDNIVDWTFTVSPYISQGGILKSIIMSGERQNGQTYFRQINPNHDISTGQYIYSSDNIDSIKTIDMIGLIIEYDGDTTLEFSTINVEVSVQCVEEDPDIFTEAVIVDLQTGAETDILTYMNTNTQLKSFADYDVLIYEGGTALAANMTPGFKSIRLADSENTYYSEWFLPCSNLDEFIKLEYWRDTDLVFEQGRIVYSDGYIQTLYLDSDIGKPKYLFEIEETARNGYFFNEKTVSKKRYSFAVIVPEFMTDLLSRLPNHEYITIIENGIQNRVTKIDILEADWQDTGDLALLPIEFETNTVISSGTQVTGSVNELLANETEAINIRGNNKRIFQLNDVTSLEGLFIAVDKEDLTEAGRISLADFKAGGFDYIDMNPQLTDPDWKVGRFFYDDNENTWTFYNDIEEVALQLGEEIRARLYNDNGFTLLNGKVGYVKGSNGAQLLCGLATANDIDQSIRTLGIFTHDINDATQGYIVRYGRINNVDTSAWSTGDPLYLDPITPGELTNVRPRAPYYVVRIGIVLYSDATVGAIGVDTIAFNGNDTEVNLDGALNGIVVEKPSSDFVIDTGVVYFETDNEGEPTQNLDFIYDGTRYTLDTTTGSGTGGKARVALTAGTDTAPQINYIYIVMSGGVGILTANTTGFPTGSSPIGICNLQSVATTTTYGVLAFRCWNNAVDNGTGNGILQYLAKRIRLEGSKWVSGVDPTVTITTNPSAIDNLVVETTSGIVYQLHEQTFQAKDGTEYYIVNHPTTPYLRITDLNEADVDANGNTLRSNNTRYGLNLIGVQNSADEIDRFFVFLPNGTYSSDNDTIYDVNNYSVVTPPANLSGVCFRILRLVLRYETSSSGTIVNILGAGGYQDERGQPLGTGGGGSGSGGSLTNFSDSSFTVYNSVDATKIMALDVSGVTTGNTRTLAIPDKNGTIKVEDIVTDTVADSASAYLVAVGDITLESSVKITYEAKRGSLVEIGTILMTNVAGTTIFRQALDSVGMQIAKNISGNVLNLSFTDQLTDGNATTLILNIERFKI